MITYLNGPNGMYPARDHMAYQAMVGSRREVSNWAGRRYTGRPACGGRPAKRRALVSLIGVALTALLFILVLV